MRIRTAKLVTFGDGGDMVYLGGGSTCSGYGSPERPHAAAPGDDKAFPDGTPAIDKRPALATDAGYRLVFRGPMVDVDLPTGEVDRCPQPSDIMAVAMMTDPGNEFGALLGLQAASRARKDAVGPLDSADILTYVEMWRAVGARIGSYKGGVIVWEGGAS